VAERGGRLSYCKGGSEERLLLQGAGEGGWATRLGLAKWAGTEATRQRRLCSLTSVPPSALARFVREVSPAACPPSMDFFQAADQEAQPEAVEAQEEVRGAALPT
jgi:hypothetical protein